MTNHIEEPSLLNKIIKILNKEDPEGLIKMGAPPDEYLSEARCIYCGLEKGMSAKKIQNLIHRTFKYWFSRTFSKDSEACSRMAKKIKKAMK